MSKLNTKPLTIGFFTTSVEREYSSRLCSSLVKLCEQNNVRLIIFLGGALYPEIASKKQRYDYQHNVAFNYALSYDIDGIIMSSSGISSFVTENEFKQFYSKYSSVPMVSLGIDIKDMPSITIDNTKNFKAAITHLISYHHRKKLAFISGPICNLDAQIRYKSYQESLEDNNIPFNPELIYLGDFTRTSGAQAIQYFFDEKHLDIDAIVCANDDMAMAALQELSHRNINVPDQVALIGYDNSVDSYICSPALTTISQPLDQLAEKGFNMLMDILSGKIVSNSAISCELVYRESCGCSSLASYTRSSKDDTIDIKKATHEFLDRNSHYITNIDSLKLEYFIYELFHYAAFNTFANTFMDEFLNLFQSLLSKPSTTIETVINLEKLFRNLNSELSAIPSYKKGIKMFVQIMSHIHYALLNWMTHYFNKQQVKNQIDILVITQIIRDIPSNIHSLSQQLQAIIEKLMFVGIDSFVIYTYENEIIYNSHDIWEMPDYLLLQAGYINNVPIEVTDSNRRCKPENLFDTAFFADKPSHSVFMHSISFGNEQLGVILFSAQPSNYYLVNTLVVELGCSIKLCNMFSSQKSIQDQLKELSETDELTRLLNRRGFFDLASQRYELSRVRQKEGILFFADMDGLKRINDTYGHHEGDIAIIAMANILKKVFSSQDIIGRIGGDEFTVLCLDRSYEYITHVKELIAKYTLEYNREVDKPYKLSITLGAFHFPGDTSDSLDTIISKSDKVLYHEKEKRPRQH